MGGYVFLSRLCYTPFIVAIHYKSIHRPIDLHSRGNVNVRALVDTIDEGELDLDPPYQRGHVWSLREQQDFIGYLLEGGETTAAYIRYLETSSEVVDGKQRITAIYLWWKGQISARLSDGREVWSKDMAADERRFVNMDLSLPVNYVVGTDMEIMKMYLRLNRGGKAHDPSELARVENLIQEGPV